MKKYNLAPLLLVIFFCIKSMDNEVQRAEQFAKKAKKPGALSKGPETISLTDVQHPPYLSDAELKGLEQEAEITSGKPKKIADVRTQMLITAALNSVKLQKND